jgi:signal peptidase II
MKRFLQHLIVFFGLLSISYLVQQFFLEQGSLETNIGFLHFKVYQNSSFIFGLFRESSHFVRIVINSVSMGILILIAFYFYASLAKELTLIRWGVTFMLAGMIGNGLEKLLNEYVIDYAFFAIPGIRYFCFNMNDAIQLIGFTLTVKEIFHKQDIIWFPNIRRHRLLLYRDVQLSIVIRMLGLFFIGSLTQMVLAFSLLFPHLDDDSDGVQTIFLLSFVAVNCILLPIVGIFLVKELLKCVGPIYALEKHLNDESRDGIPLKLRKTDYFTTLEASFNKFLERHQKKD